MQTASENQLKIAHDRVRVVPFATALNARGIGRQVAVARMMTEEVGGPHFYQRAMTLLRRHLSGELSPRDVLSEAKAHGTLIHEASSSLLQVPFFHGAELLRAEHPYWSVAGFSVSAWQDIAVRNGGISYRLRLHFSKDHAPAHGFGETTAQLMRLASRSSDEERCVFAVYDVFNRVGYRALGDPLEVSRKLTQEAWELRSVWNRMKHTG